MDTSENRPRNWELMQVGVVVRDMDQAIARLTELGFDGWVERVLPPEREPGSARSWFRRARPTITQLFSTKYRISPNRCQRLGTDFSATMATGI